MSAVSSRLNRILIAAGVGLIVAVCASLMIEEGPSAAISRGDFPAFYTLAVLAHSGEGHRLYDLELQRQIQNVAWPTLSGTMLPAAYPAFLAKILEPFAMLSPSVARIVWVCSMVVSTVVGVLLLARTVPALGQLSWQLVVGAFLFGPLFLGVLGGQIVGVSFLLYAALIALNRRGGGKCEILFGAITGMWMFKPHYALAVVAMMVFQRRWTACAAWLFVSALLWLVGVQVAGMQWFGDWLSFAQQFSQIDLATNSHQMTGIVPCLYSILVNGGWSRTVSAQGWESLVGISALLVPATLFVVVQRARGTHGERMKPLLMVGPLLLLFAPAVNFYDLSLGLVPLLVIFHPRERRDLVLAASLVVASQLFVLYKDLGFAGGAFFFTLVITGMVSQGLSRSQSWVRGQRSYPVLGAE